MLSTSPLVYAKAHVELPDGVSYDKVRAVFNGTTFRAFDTYGTLLYEAAATVQATSTTTWTLLTDAGPVSVEKAGCGCSGR